MKLKIDIINISIVQESILIATGNQSVQIAQVTQLVNDGISESLHTVILDNGKLKKKI